MSERLASVAAPRNSFLPAGDDFCSLKVAATSMAHLEALVNEVSQFGDTTTSLVYRQTLPYRGPQGP